MYHQHRIAGWQSRKSRNPARNLIGKAFAAGRGVAGRRFPEIAVGIAEFGQEIVVTPSGPAAKILLAKQGLPDRIEPEGNRSFKGPPRRAANGKGIWRQ